MQNIDDVVKSGLCLGCGICTYSGAIEKTVYSKTRDQFIPLITKENKNDSLAYKLCPGKGYNIIGESKSLYNSPNYDLQLGFIYNQYAAYTNDNKVLKNASSGGVMTQIAIYLLENNLADRVLTTHFIYTSGPQTVCILAKSKDEIISSQGSKYCPVDLSEAINEIKNNEYRVAVIGTPCQIAGIRNIQKSDEGFSSKIVLTIANFCGGFKSYNNINLLAKRKGISFDQITNFRFRGNGQPGSMLIEDKSGKKVEMAYPKYVGLNGEQKHLRCHLCVDATGELADIACGDAWVPRFLEDKHPWSVILTRNKLADDLIMRMIDQKIITTNEITVPEIKYSQRQNLASKKVRQKSRFFLYKRLGYEIPFFDGGYFDNKLNLFTEIQVYTKHKAKHLLEKLNLFYFFYKFLKK